MNDIEKSADRIYTALEEELRGKSNDHAKAVIAAVLSRIGRVTIKDGESRTSVRCDSAISLIDRMVSAIKLKSGKKMRDDDKRLIEKLEGVRATISQTNNVTPRQQMFLAMTAKEVVASKARAR